MLPAQGPATQVYSSHIRLALGLIQGPIRVIQRRTVLVHALLQFGTEPDGTTMWAATGRYPRLHTQCVSRTYKVTQATYTGHTFT